MQSTLIRWRCAFIYFCGMSIGRLCFLGVLMLNLLQSELKAQTPFYRNYTVEDGLASSTVYAVHQDRSGFLWFSTESGVSKFDGIFFKNYGRAQGLGDNEIFNVYEDSSGRLWFLPFNGRLSFYDDGLVVGPDKDDRLRKVEISSTFTQPFEENSGELWFGTQRDSGVAWISEMSAGMVRVPFRNIQVLDVRKSEIDIGSGNYRYTFGLNRSTEIPQLGLEIRRDTFIPKVAVIPQFGEYPISSYLEDRESNKWYTTLGSGVLMRSRSYVNFLDKDHGLYYENVYSITNLFDSSLLTGFQDGTLQMWSKTQSIRTVLGQSGYNRILDIFLHDEIWVGSDRGLFVLDKRTLQEKKQYPGSIKCLTEFEGSLYFGTSGGAFRIAFNNPDSVEKLFSERTISLLVLSKNEILIGTNKGLIRLSNGIAEDLSGEHPLLSGRVRAMCSLTSGVVAMGTHGEGLLLRHPGGYSVVNMDKGLSSNICHAVFRENDSTLWLGTNNGLNKLRFVNGNYERPIVDVYKRSDGLKSNYVNDIYVDQNQVFVASDKGVSFFEIQTGMTRRNPVTYIYRIAINDRDTSIEGEYVLSHDQNELLVEYSAIAYESGKNTKFQYRILGLDSQWRTTSQRILSFQAIPPGKYELQVYALATDGSRSEFPAGFRFTIRKPFWATWWFRSLVVLILLGLVWRITRFIIAFNHRKDVEERNMALKAKNEEIEAERKRSDELLLNILPEDTALELKANGKVKAKKHEQATILFSDFEGFTSLSTRVSPEELVLELDYCFRAFDEIMAKYNLEKIKTIGDAYMCAAGLTPGTSSDPAAVVYAALEIQEFMERYRKEHEAADRPVFRARIGIHTGEVVSGVVGLKKFAFDIWGDAVNTAARMESNGEVVKINISRVTYELVKDQFECTSRGMLSVKGKGEMEMFFVDRPRT